MKIRQRKIAALLMAAMMTCVPAVQAFAQTEYSIQNGIEDQVLFPKDSIIGIEGPVQVNGEDTPAENGIWTNEDNDKVYTANQQEDGTLQITEAGYVLELENGTSKEKDKEDTIENHYQFGEWEKPEKSIDLAYYQKDAVVELKADEPEEGMEFKEWVCDTEGVQIEDPSSPETTLTMIDKKVTVRAEYQEKQPEEAAAEETQAAEEPTAEEPAAEEQQDAENGGQNDASSDEVLVVGTDESAENTENPAADVVPAEDSQESVSGSEDGTQEIPVQNEEQDAGTIEVGNAEFDITTSDSYSDQAQETEPVKEYKITVENGSIDGYEDANQDVTDDSESAMVPAGTDITIHANDRTEQGYVFSGWKADSETFELPDSLLESMTITVPEEDLVLTAEYTEAETQPAETQEQETQPAEAETQAAETPAAETQAAETQAADSNGEENQNTDVVVITDETNSNETQASETQAAETQASETQAAETQASETQAAETQASETQAAETQASETQAAETQAPETQPTEAPVPEAETYEVTVENGGIGSGEYQAGETITVEAPDADDNQLFESWTASSDAVVFANASDEVTTFVMPEEAVTVTPQYTEPRSVTVDENTTISPSAEELQAPSANGTTVTISAKDRSSEGLKFANWTAEALKGDTAVNVIFADAFSADTTFTMPECDSIKLTANYAEETKSYKVTVANGLINNSASEMMIDAGTSITVTADPSPTGQAFTYWTINDGTYDIGDAAYDQTITLTVQDQDLNIKANYEGIEYGIYVTDGTGNYETAVSGTTVKIKADAAPDGYEFDSWSVDSGNASLADAYSTTTTFTMPADDVYVTANYKQVEYKVTIENGSSSSTSYHAGDTVTIKSNYPASGREFSAWESVSGNVSFADSSRWQTTFTMPASDVTVRAVYKNGPSASDNAILNLVEGGEYKVAETLKFTASGAGMDNDNPNPGDYRYRPTGYQIGNVNGTLQSPYSVSMAINAAGEYTLKATFTKEVYNGSSWVADGTSDTKSVTFRVVTAAESVQTGDSTPIAAVAAVAVVSCLVFIVLLVVFIRRRRKN